MITLERDVVIINSVHLFPCRFRIWLRSGRGCLCVLARPCGLISRSEQLNLIADDVCRVDGRSVLLLVASGLDLAGDRHLLALRSILLDYISGLSECFAPDEVSGGLSFLLELAVDRQRERCDLRALVSLCVSDFWIFG